MRLGRRRRKAVGSRLREGVYRMYTINDARRECVELLDEGRDVWCFLNDLVRGGDITRDEWRVIMTEIVEGKLRGCVR